MLDGRGSIGEEYKDVPLEGYSDLFGLRIVVEDIETLWGIVALLQKVDFLGEKFEEENFTLGKKTGYKGYHIGYERFLENGEIVRIEVQVRIAEWDIRARYGKAATAGHKAKLMGYSWNFAAIDRIYWPEDAAVDLVKSIKEIKKQLRKDNRVYIRVEDRVGWVHFFNKPKYSIVPVMADEDEVISVLDVLADWRVNRLADAGLVVIRKYDYDKSKAMNDIRVDSYKERKSNPENSFTLAKCGFNCY